MKTAFLAAATALAAMSGPALAQWTDPSILPIDRPPPAVFMATIPDPTAAPPPFYSTSTPYGQALSTTTQTGGTTITHTYGPGGTITTCFTTRSGPYAIPTVNCF